MNAAFWNVRGANRVGFSNEINTLKRNHNLHFLAILEPRLSGIKAQKICKKLGFSNFHIEDARGFSGGIWTLWDSDKLDIHIIHSTAQDVSMLAFQNNKAWVQTVIYANPNPRVRKGM